MNYKIVIVVDVESAERASELGQAARQFLTDTQLDLNSEDTVANYTEEE